MVVGGLVITPYSAAQSRPSICRPYSERAQVGSTALALDYAAKDITDARSELGIRTDKLRSRMPCSRYAAVSPGHMTTIPTVRSQQPSRLCRGFLRPQRRGAGVRLSIDHRFARNRMDERLVGQP
jgi:hypothetical protein